MATFNVLVDGILLSASLVACFYCILLARRIRRLASADQGLGKGIADMTAAVERLHASLEETRSAARKEAETLQERIGAARTLAARMEEVAGDSDRRLDDLAKGLAEARRLVAVLEGLAETAGKRRRRAAREKLEAWDGEARPDLADGLPGALADGGSWPGTATPPRSRKMRMAADGARTPNGWMRAAADPDDPFADVMPLARRPARRDGRKPGGDA